MVEMHKPLAGSQVIDVQTLSDKEKYRLDIYHVPDHKESRRRLKGPYGRLAWLQNEQLIATITGERVLDVGAGYGLLASQLKMNGFEVVAIEPVQEYSKFAKAWYDVDLLPLEVYETPFGDGEFDTVVMREVVEHLDFELAMKEIKRICRGTVVIFETNLNLLTRLARRVMGHQEFNPGPFSYYADVLQRHGYRIESIVYRDVVAFPLLGGYSGPILFPQHEGLVSCLLALDAALNRGLALLHLQPFLCWRGLIRAVRR